MLCSHKQNPQACLACYQEKQARQAEERRAVAPESRWGGGSGMEINPPPMLKRNVHRALMGHVANGVQGEPVRGEQAVAPVAKSRPAVRAEAGGVAAPEAYVSPTTEPAGEELWDPPPDPRRLRGDVIDRLPQHPDAVKR